MQMVEREELTYIAGPVGRTGGAAVGDPAKHGGVDGDPRGPFAPHLHLLVLAHRQPLELV